MLKSVECDYILDVIVEFSLFYLWSYNNLTWGSGTILKNAIILTFGVFSVISS